MQLTISDILFEDDPKKGTGKKPKGSSRRLYTDEDPKDTVGVKFSSRQDIVDTLNKKSFKAKSHARQSQIINLIHQRTRAAYGRAKQPDVKKRLKTALDYIEKRKEASKKKTQRLKKEVVNEGKYDSLVTKLAGYTLNAWKGDYEDNQRKGYFEIEVGPGKEFDYPHLDFIYKAQAIFGYNIATRQSGYATPMKPQVVLKYTINKSELPQKWEDISMSIRNIIRHEIEHLMQAGPNVKKGKEMDSDQAKRKELSTGKKPWWKIWRRTLGTPEYYKLEKEIDANLQGLYLKAKKSRQPLEKVIDDYLEYTLYLDKQDREDIKDLWRKRAPKLNIPLEESLWANINAKKKRGEKSSHKNSKAYKKAVASGNKLKKSKLKEIILEVLYEGPHDPVKPGILKKRLGTLSCSKVRKERSKLKDKGTHYAKALQRYLNYHCQ